MEPQVVTSDNQGENESSVVSVPEGTQNQTYQVCGYTFVLDNGRLVARPPLKKKILIGKFCNGKIHDVFVDEGGILVYEYQIPNGPASHTDKKVALNIRNLKRVFSTDTPNNQIRRICKGNVVGQTTN